MSRWIPKNERPPAAKDADKQGCVLVWHRYNHVMVMIWQHAAENSYVLAWMPTPEAPDLLDNVG